MDRQIRKAKPLEFGTVSARQKLGMEFGLPVYVDRLMIESQIDRLAEELRRKFEKTEKPLFCPILNGASFFYHDLARALRPPNPEPHDPEMRSGVDGVFNHPVAFIAARRYGMETKGSNKIQVSWFAFDNMDIHGKTILLIDDILDEGLTVKTVTAGLLERGVEKVVSIFACRKVPPKDGYQPDYVMFDVPRDIWCVGYGMDFRNHLRNTTMILDASSWVTDPIAFQAFLESGSPIPGPRTPDSRNP